MNLKALTLTALLISIIAPISITIADNTEQESTLLIEAKAGNAEAQHKLAELYHFGTGVEQDYA